MAVSTEAVLKVLQQLSHDIRDLDIGTSVDHHQKLPVVQFLRDYVAANKPVVLTGVVSHWPAFSNWTDDYLCSLAGDTEVTVALTPNGRADAVTPLPDNSTSSCASPTAASPCVEDGNWICSTGQEAVAGRQPAAAAGAPIECFALPHQVKMPLRDFLALLRSSKEQKAAAAAAAAEWQSNGSGASGSSSCTGDQGNGDARHGGEGGVAAATQPPLVVPYLQYQNSSLTAEVPQLLGDIDLLLSWATQAFGGLPEAVNLWIGDERSITSWHKDPFENIYAVLAGSKTFMLLPPAEVYRMRMKRYAQATYKPAAAPIEGARLTSASSTSIDSIDGAAAVLSGGVKLEPVLEGSGEQVLWSSVLPDPDAAAKRAAEATVAVGSNSAAAAPEPERDLFADPSLPPPLRVTVKAGEALYLPACWWHQVEQKPDAAGRAIAVNYWYDMKFDARQAYLLAVERLAELLGLNEPPPQPPAPVSVASEHGYDHQQLRPPYHSARAAG